MYLFLGSRLLYLLQQGSSSSELQTECAVVLGSLAMGTENNIKSLVDCHIIPALLQGDSCSLSLYCSLFLLASSPDVEFSLLPPTYIHVNISIEKTAAQLY